MRAVVFTTGTTDTEKLIQSFTCLGHDTRVVRYDVPGVDVAAIAGERYDVGIWIGAVPEFHQGPVPSTMEICRANRATPLIHICSDAGDAPWWPLLEEYHAAGAFRLQVAIDGSHDSPLGRFGRVELTPVDDAWFPAIPWHGRLYRCGFVGGTGGRVDLLNRLSEHPALFRHLNRGGAPLRYQHLCAFYAMCRTVVNDDHTGSAQYRHVKGRFVEAALAGAAVIEPENSPAQDWFRPGIDYLTWGDAEDVLRHVRVATGERIMTMARRLQAQMRERFSARPFWARVLAAARIG
jgi:hypothetical protein